MSIYVEKIDKATPAQGNILNSPSSMSETDALSIKATINAIPPPLNKLINGFFLCNQRGLSEYIGNAAKLTYTVDMWRTVTTVSTIASKVKKISEGVNFSSTGTGNANFEQILSLNPASYTCTANINNLVGSGSFVVELKDKQEWIQKDLTNGINTLEIPNGSIPIRIIIRLNNTSSVDIEYVDLFEGDIVYPHVKEDYSIALLRCQRYVKAYSQSCPIKYEYGSSTFSYLIKCDFDEMYATPTVTNCNYAYINQTSNNSSSNIVTVGNIYINSFILTTNPMEKMNDKCKSVDVDFIVTCEPI